MWYQDALLTLCSAPTSARTSQPPSTLVNMMSSDDGHQGRSDADVFAESLVNLDGRPQPKRQRRTSTALPDDAPVDANALLITAIESKQW